MFPWPTVVLLLFFTVTFSKFASSRVAELFKPFRSVKAFGAELVFTEERTREVSRTVRETFDAYRKEAQTEYDRLVASFNLREKLENVLKADSVQQVHRLLDTPEVRCTLYVPDVLFSEALYQLIDYYPRGLGRGRRISIRFGIVGKTWRTGQTEIRGDVPAEEDNLVLHWGMTQEEASAAGNGRRSFASVVLRGPDETKVGILYLDSTALDAFGRGDDRTEVLEQALVQSCSKSGLTESLAELSHQLRSKSLQLTLYG